MSNGHFLKAISVYQDKNSSWDARLFAIGVLKDCYDEPATRIILEALKDESAEARRLAAKSLKFRREVNALPVLMSAKEAEGDEKVRQIIDEVIKFLEQLNEQKGSG